MEPPSGSPNDLPETWASRNVDAHAKALARLWRAIATGSGILEAQEEYARVAGLGMADAAARGADRTWAEAGKAAERVARRAAVPGYRGAGPPPARRRGAPPPPEPDRPGRWSPGLLPRVKPEEAIRDLLARRVYVARSADAVARLYGRAHAFAAARAATVTVAEKVRDEIAKALADGKTRDRAVRAVVRASGGEWTANYADVVFRTNAAGAYTAGMFATAADPAVRMVIPGVSLVTANDVDTRPNHRAAHGLTGSVDDPAWDTIASPLGYRCRCRMVLRDVDYFAARGLLLASGKPRRIVIPAGAYPDAGFRRGVRPDLAAALARAV